MAREPRHNLCPPEEFEQIALADWLRAKGIKFTASANGGLRHISEGVRFKKMGVSAGFPDLFIPKAIAPYHGLFLELKRQKGGTVSPAQRDWLRYLEENGYYAVTARGFEEAKEIIEHYFSLVNMKVKKELR
jgi:hypothetical protein